jgi:cobalamin biosynthesis protein CobW
LLSDDELMSVSDDLRSQLRIGANLVPTTQGMLDIAILLGQKASAEDDMHNRLSTHEQEGETQHDHDDFVTFIIELNGEQNKETLLKRIANTIATNDILRVKGFASVAGSNARLLVQAVGPRLNSYFDRPWNAGEVKRTQLVVIGEKAIDQVAIAKALVG